MSETREAGKANDVPSPPCGVLSPLHEDSKPHSATALSKLRIDLCSAETFSAGFVTRIQPLYLHLPTDLIAEYC